MKKVLAFVCQFTLSVYNNTVQNDVQEIKVLFLEKQKFAWHGY